MSSASYDPPLKRRKLNEPLRQRLDISSTSGRIAFREDTQAQAVLLASVDPSIAGWEPPESLEYALDEDGARFDLEMETEAFESEAWHAEHGETVPPPKGRSKTSVRDMSSLGFPSSRFSRGNLI